MPNLSSVKADAVQQQKTTGGHSCQLQRGNTFHWITTSSHHGSAAPVLCSEVSVDQALSAIFTASC